MQQESIFLGICHSQNQGAQCGVTMTQNEVSITFPVWVHNEIIWPWRSESEVAFSIHIQYCVGMVANEVSPQEGQHGSIHTHERITVSRQIIISRMVQVFS